jgi:hypothetical protein
MYLHGVNKEKGSLCVIVNVCMCVQVIRLLLLQDLQQQPQQVQVVPPQQVKVMFTLTS